MKNEKCCIALFCIALFSAPVSAAQVDPIKGRIMAAGGTEQMTVTRVDQKSREVVLRSADGEETSFVAGPEVRNLAQVEAGDTVTITYAEGVAIRVYPISAGAKGRVEKTERSRAPLGAKPYAMMSRQVEITAQVEALDKAARTATLAGKHGSLTLQVAEDVDLSNIAVGDMVRVDYLERLKISVDAPSD